MLATPSKTPVALIVMLAVIATYKILFRLGAIGSLFALPRLACEFVSVKPRFLNSLQAIEKNLQAPDSGI